MAAAAQSGATETPSEAAAPGGAGRVVDAGRLVAYVLAFGLWVSCWPLPPSWRSFLAYGERRWPVVVAVALGATGATYGLFAVWLGVPLPQGLLGR